MAKQLQDSWPSKTYAMFHNAGGAWQQYAIVDRTTALALIAGAASGKLAAHGHEGNDKHVSGEEE